MWLKKGGVKITDYYGRPDGFFWEPVLECFSKYYNAAEWYDFRLWLSLLQLRGFTFTEEKTETLLKKCMAKQDDSVLESVVTEAGITSPSRLGLALPLRKAIIMLAAVTCEKSINLKRRYKGVFDCFGIWPLSELTVTHIHHRYFRIILS